MQGAESEAGWPLQTMVGGGSRREPQAPPPARWWAGRGGAGPWGAGVIPACPCVTW